jgi:hypothetical protein
MDYSHPTHVTGFLGTDNVTLDANPFCYMASSRSKLPRCETVGYLPQNKLIASIDNMSIVMNKQLSVVV